MDWRAAASKKEINFMKRIFFLLTLVLVGCHKDERQNNAHDVRLLLALNKLGATQIQQNFAQEKIEIPAPGEDTDHDGIQTHWTPGSVGIAPITVADDGKPETEVKGAYVYVASPNYTVSSRYTGPTSGKLESGFACLDEDELQALRKSISHFSDLASAWRSKSPSIDTEVKYTTRNNLSFEVSQDEDKKIMFLIHVGDANLNLKDAQVSELGQKLDGVLSALKAH